MQETAGVRAGALNTCRYIPEPERMPGLCCPVSWDGSCVKSRKVPSLRGCRRRPQSPACPDLFILEIPGPRPRHPGLFHWSGPKLTPSTLHPWSPGAGFCFVQQIRGRVVRTLLLWWPDPTTVPEKFAELLGGE